MSIAASQLEHSVAEAAKAPLLWGMSATELHDAYWRTLGVSVARPGKITLLHRDAGLYLLVQQGETVLLDFPRVLYVMGWMRPELCMLRPRQPSPAAGGAIVTRDRPWRCAVASGVALAEAWCHGDGSLAAWRRVKGQVHDSRWCVARPLGRIYGEASGQRFLERLAQIWTDPTEVVPTIKKLGRGAYGWKDGARGGSIGHGARVWLGRGRTLAEVPAGQAACVLPDLP